MRKKRKNNLGLLKFKNPFSALLLLFIVLILPLTILIGSKINDLRGRSAGTGAFQVIGNKIVDPNGNQFIVKGMTPIYGPFAGGDNDGSWSTYSMDNATSIFNDLKNNWSGVNLVRIFTSGAGANGTGPSDWNTPDYRNKLWDIVQKARNAGFVVLLVNSYSNITDTRSWIKELAAKYKDDPYVWITPSNEPFCTSPNSSESSNCTGGTSEWQYWQPNMNTFISDIRSQGFHNPILINSIQWSWDLSKIGTYTLTDPDNKLIYGSHRYANENTSFSTAEQNSTNTSWANLATTYPIVADEIGNCNGGLTQFTWLQGATDFITNWVNTRGGAGMIAFNHYWSDCNTQTTNGTTRNSWGNYFLNNYLSKVSGTIGGAVSITPSVGPVSPSPTVTSSPQIPTNTPTNYPVTATPTLTTPASGSLSVTVTVFDSTSGGPVQGASVVFNNVSSVSNSLGKATFSAPAGSYPLTITKSGYTTYSWSANTVTAAWPMISVGLNPTSGSTYTPPAAAPPPSSGDTTAPSVSMNAPLNGELVDVNNWTLLRASASDNKGVSTVEFYVNNSIACSDTSSPYSCYWKVPSSRNKSYSISAKAYDAAQNNKKSGAVTVTSK